MNQFSGHPVRALLLFGLLFFPLAASAEIAPQYYRAMQEQAPEFLEIQVLDVSQEWCIFDCSDREVRVSARITKVHRTSAGLREGNLLYITYRRRLLNGRSGPRPIPLLEKDQTYPAYLKRVGVDKARGVLCETVAKGYSFQTVPAP